MKASLIYVGIVFILFSCKKEEVSINDSNSNRIYSATEYYNNGGLPIMGGCLDSSGNLVSFNLPLLASSSGFGTLIPARIFKLNEVGQDSTLVNFQGTQFAFGAYHNHTVNGVNGWLAGYARVNLLYLNDGRMFMSSDKNYSNKLSEIIQGQVVLRTTINGLTSITHYRNDIYAITTPIYDQNQNVVQNSVIYKVDSIGNISTYYSFPGNVVFSYNCGTGGDGLNNNYPLDVLISIKASNDGTLYISSGYDNVIYKLDENKVLSVYNQNIFCPTNMAFDRYNRMYVASASRYTYNPDSISFNCNMTKPIEVYKVASLNTQEVIYQGPHNNYVGCLFVKNGFDKCVISDANIGINIDESFRIFLEIPNEGKVILLQ